jgi:hypothetical protein
MANLSYVSKTQAILVLSFLTPIKKEGRLLQDIIEQAGIQRFLEIEEACICEACFKNAVIATGGSVVYSNKAMRTLKQEGIIIYLKISYEEMIRPDIRLLALLRKYEVESTMNRRSENMGKKIFPSRIRIACTSSLPFRHSFEHPGFHRLRHII